MKTYESEKHNIPEGATHYCNESDDMYFSWFKGVDTEKFEVMSMDIKGEWVSEVQYQYRNDGITIIPQTKEVEWVSGLPPVGSECELFNCGNSWVKARVLFMGAGLCVVDHGYGDQHYHLNSVKFRKPETEVGREERERKEARASIERLLEDRINFHNSMLPKTISKIIYDAGYRKEG